MPRSGDSSRVATVEDYNSDNDEVIENTLKQANVKAKRSDPSDLGLDKTADPVGPDAASDSGYSSHTAATMSSADSSQRSKKGSLPASEPAPILTAPSRSSKSSGSPVKSSKRRSIQAEKVITQHPPLSRSNSTRKQPPARSESRTRRPSRREECTKPGCTECGSYKEPNRSPPMPSSPTASRRPTSGYYSGAAIIQPAQTARRRSSSTTRNGPRPNSYHEQWPQYVGQTSAAHGPPPSHSAYMNIPRQTAHPIAMQQAQMSQFPPYGQTPPSQMQYNYVNHMQASPASTFDAGVAAASMRPPLQTRATDSAAYSTRRPSLAYGQPVILHDNNAAQAIANNPRALTTQRPSARYAPAGEQFASQWDSETESSSSSSEEDEYDDEGFSAPSRGRRDTDSRKMPPPPLPTKLTRQPSNRKPEVSNPFSPNFPQPAAPEVNYGSTPREHRDRSRTITTAASSRTNSSNRRPSIASSRTTGATSYSGASNNSNVIVESARRGRRISYMGHESRGDLEAKHREMLYNTIAEPYAYAQPHYEDRPLPRAEKEYHAERPKERNTRRDSRIMYEPEPERKRTSKHISELRSAEDYIQSRNGGDTDPLTDYLRANNIRDEATKSKRNSRVPSDDKSVASRSSAGRTTVTKDGAIKIGIENGHAMTLQFDGPMDGKTLQIRQGENGMSELVIGTAGLAVRDNKRYIAGSEARSKVGSKVTTRERERDESSVSDKSSRKSDKNARGRKVRKDMYDASYPLYGA